MKMFVYKTIFVILGLYLLYHFTIGKKIEYYEHILKNLTNKTIRFEITLESKDSEDYGTCNVFKKCKNMNYSFFVEKDYEIISGLQEGHYKLKSIDYFIDSSDIPAGNLMLSEEFKLFRKNLIISNTSFIYDGKLKINITKQKTREIIISKLNVLVNRKLWTLVNSHNNLDQLNKSNKVGGFEEQTTGLAAIDSGNECIILPISTLGNVSDTRKQILQNTLEGKLKTFCKIISQERFEKAQEKAFEELDYEECTEDQCIMLIQEMLQVENAFHLQVIEEDSNTQLSLSWRTLDEKKKETDVCIECGTFQLNDKVGKLVNNLVISEKIIKNENKESDIIISTKQKTNLLYLTFIKGQRTWVKEYTDDSIGKYEVLGSRFYVKLS